MSSLPPRHLCIAGALFIAAGVGAVIHIVASLIAGRIFFDFGFIGIAIGYGILIGRASSRKWALFLAIAVLVGTVLFGASTAYDHFTGSAPLPYPASIYMIIEVALFSGSCLYVLTALWRSGHQEWFTAEKEERSAAQTLAWAVAAVAGVFLSSQSVTEWWRQERYEKAQPFRVRVIPYHAVTGKGMTTLSYRCEAGESSNEIKPKLPKVDAIFIGGKEGPQYEFHGQAAQPFEVALKSEGFEDKVITLCGKAEYDIRVPMQPLVATQAKRGTDGKPAAPVVKE